MLYQQQLENLRLAERELRLYEAGIVAIVARRTISASAPALALEVEAKRREITHVEEVNLRLI